MGTRRDGKLFIHLHMYVYAMANTHKSVVVKLQMSTSDDARLFPINLSVLRLFGGGFLALFK